MIALFLLTALDFLTRACYAKKSVLLKEKILAQNLRTLFFSESLKKTCAIQIGSYANLICSLYRFTGFAKEPKLSSDRKSLDRMLKITIILSVSYQFI